MRTGIVLGIAFVLVSVSSFHPGLAGVGGVGLDQYPAEAMPVASSNPVSTPADYDSGWITFGLDEKKTINHDLGGNPEDYVVDVQAIGSFGIVNQLNFGSDTTIPDSVSVTRYGFFWQALDNTSIEIMRVADDYTAMEIRVRIWVVQEVDYDSGWRAVVPASTLNLEHNLGGNPEDYIIDLQFKSTGFAGVHKRSYGIDTSYNNQVGENLQEWGAYYYRLNDKAVKVNVGEDALEINELCVRI